MITLYGADYSVYVRSVRLAMEEKGIEYRLVPVDVFVPEDVGEDHLARHPFGKIPALDHDGFQLYETAAILRYVDEVMDGPALQPDDPRHRARMDQILSILDNYAYPTLVWGIYVERVSKTRSGDTADEVAIASAMGRARTTVNALETFAQDTPFLLGERPTLADCHAAPMLNLFRQAEEGTLLLKSSPKLSAFLDHFTERESFLRTAPSSDSR
ncbi:glutathione S-transferase family protein [Rhodobacterales bacterium]|nr:glutathione S-transferase family protein [Rhodobacterales bacterium]